MKYHELGYELERDEMRLVIANSFFGDVRMTGILKTFDPASRAGRRAAVRSHLFAKMGESHLVAIHEASPELKDIRAERAAILALRETMSAAELRDPTHVPVILGRTTLAWALDSIRPYVDTQSGHVANPEHMQALMSDYDQLEAQRMRAQIVAGTELEIAS